MSRGQQACVSFTVGPVTDARRRPPPFGDPFIAEAIGDLQEAWMRHAGTLRGDEPLVATVHTALRATAAACAARADGPAG